MARNDQPGTESAILTCITGTKYQRTLRQIGVTAVAYVGTDRLWPHSVVRWVLGEMGRQSREIERQLGHGPIVAMELLEHGEDWRPLSECSPAEIGNLRPLYSEAGWLALCLMFDVEVA